MENILITGANGFIGRALCDRLSNDNKVIGMDITSSAGGAPNILWERADLTDRNSVAVICQKYSPDVVIHCAGIAHQKIGAIDSATYMRVNSEATEHLARAAAQYNPDVCFVFLSSISVYGEHTQIASRKMVSARSSGPSGQGKAPEKMNQVRVDEDSDCWPSSDYALSKLDAERRLVALSDEGMIRDLIMLRLAPVYDREWSLNLDRRVFAPWKIAYLKFGSGLQKMSAVARPNLVEFIEFLIHRLTQINADENTIKNGRTRQNNLTNRCNLRINVCDAEPYEFNTIIRVFKESGIHPRRPILSVPLPCIRLITRIASAIFSNKREWIHSCYDKLASDLVFDNARMLGTGFKPNYSLGTLFDPQIRIKS